jgi:hypothetical protein
LPCCNSTKNEKKSIDVGTKDTSKNYLNNINTERFFPEKKETKTFDTFIANKQLHISIIRKNLESYVVNEYNNNGKRQLDKYRDAEIKLIIKQNSKTLLDTILKKEQFSKFEEKSFMNIAIFHNYWFENIEKDTIKLFGVICKPETDWCIDFHHYFDLKTKKTFAANESTKIPKISKEEISKYLLPFVTKILESSDEEIKKLWKNFKNEPMNLEEIICKQVVSNAFNFNKNENKLKSYNLKSDGTYPNKDNHYLTMPICKQEDEVCIIRFKTPSYPTKKEEYAMSDVRYYSISQGDEITYNHKTLSDKELVVSKDGYVYIIIGEEGSEITDFANTKNINFMPWLVKDKMLLIYRNMLPNPTYKNGVNCVPGYDKNNPEKNHEADFYIGAYAPMGIKIKKSILKTMHNISEYFN